MTLSQDQTEALNLMLSGKNVFLTGEAGTGKSTVLNEFRKKCDKTTVFLAPTGIAAVNIKGQTIHSFFKLKPALQTEDTIEPLEKGRRMDLIRHTHVIVIDEISMVRSDLFVAMDIRLRQIAAKSNKNKPFGGKQVIVVGDFFQLPPVIKSDFENDYLTNELGGTYAFQTELWKKSKFCPIVLTTIHRQKEDRLFVNILNNIRHNDLETQDIEFENGTRHSAVSAINALCVNKDELEPAPINLCTTNRDAESYNAMCQNALGEESVVYKAVVSGNFQERDFPTLPVLTLQKGARIMVLINKRLPNGDIEYVNGDTGTVIGLQSGTNPSVRVRLDNGNVSVISPNTWTQLEYTLERSGDGTQQIRQKETGRFVQMPLRLAYAITIHKSQGMSLSSVKIKLGSGCFAHGQLYTALSRCRSIERLRLDRKVYAEDVIVDQVVVDFYDSLVKQPAKNDEKTTISIPKEHEAAVLEFLKRLQEGNEQISDNGIVDLVPKIAEQTVSRQKIESHIDIDHLMTVYEGQTNEEQSKDSTIKKNGIGFNKFDAPILTPIAEFYLSNGFIYLEDLHTIQGLIGKYHRQWE